MSDRLAKLLQDADALTDEERAELITRLTNSRSGGAGDARPRARWCDIRGIAAPSLFGEDAQVAISRSRAESDAAREIKRDFQS